MVTGGQILLMVVGDDRYQSWSACPADDKLFTSNSDRIVTKYSEIR